MRAAGKRAAVQQQIKQEIQVRIHDLRKIDDMMQNADALVIWRVQVLVS